MRTIFTALIPVVLSVIGIGPVSAAESSDGGSRLSDRHTFIVGLARQDADAAIRVTRKGQPERALSLDDLGLDDSYNTLYLEYRFNFAERWELVVAADTFQSDGKISAHSEFNFNGEVIPAGARLNSSFDVSTMFADIMYDVLRSETSRVSLGLGVHAFQFDTNIKARIDVGNADFETSTANKELLAPLPNIRGQWIQALGEDWTFRLTAGWMSANMEDWSGDFVYAHPRIHYRFAQHFGASLGYQFTDVDVTHEGKRIESEYAVELRGPTLTFSYIL